jgi:hypothetical protein
MAHIIGSSMDGARMAHIGRIGGDVADVCHSAVATPAASGAVTVLEEVV